MNQSRPITLDAIKQEVDKRASIIEASGDVLPTYGYSEDFGQPYISVDAQGYHYIIKERGRELKHVVTSNLDDLIETIFVAVTQEIAGWWEASHRYLSAGDPRRALFKRQIELLQRLSPEWAERCLQGQQEILRESS
jgi:Immunity protein 63